MPADPAQDANQGLCSAVPRSWWWRIRYRTQMRTWPLQLRLCSPIARFARRRVGMGDSFSTFWYGIAEGAWTVCCGHSLLDGARCCIWIWRGCPSGGYFRGC